MKLAALFSGGKDSTYSIFKTQQEGNQVECLVTIFPISDESHLLHHPNIEITKLQAESMKKPHLTSKASSIDSSVEVSELEKLLTKAKDDFSIEGLVHGGILSEYQRAKFNKICSNLDLKLISPLWGQNQKSYMVKLIESEFNFIITSVTSEGLDDSLLGEQITIGNLEKLDNLAKKYHFNLNFEGGEAETLVINCPIFSYPIEIIKFRKQWDGYRGRFEIMEARLANNA